MCRLACSFTDSAPIYRRPAVYRALPGAWNHTSAPKRVLEEWETDTQEVTTQRGKQGPAEIWNVRTAMAAGETLLTPKLSFGESMTVPNCGPKGTCQRQILAGQKYL